MHLFRTTGLWDPINQAPNKSNVLSGCGWKNWAGFIFYSRLIPPAKCSESKMSMTMCTVAGAVIHFFEPCSGDGKSPSSIANRIQLEVCCARKWQKTFKKPNRIQLLDFFFLCTAWYNFCQQCSDELKMSVSKVSAKFPSITFQSISTTSKVISCHLLRYITFHETKMPNLLLSARLQETITMEGTRGGNTETLPKRHKMVRQTVTVKDKTKTKGSVSERRKDKSQAAAGGCVVTLARRVVTGRGMWGYFWCCICSPFVGTDMRKHSGVLLKGM